MNLATPTQKSTLHTLNFLADTPQLMQAEIARTDISLHEVMIWKKGTVVKFEKIVGSTIDIMIGDRLIARGEVVIVNDRYAVRLSEVTHPDEKPDASWT
ncbi:MAG: FliM/FliN family flagellar motor switch protein [SAR324 cluster bacterium]|nr:FliM/FliN family flagellar motor switch protein [SAR324 cluster bacterium]MBL7036137.1 FliM/FliN family flagellar motor switch protein [SAR324 cluster bacterium]